MLQERCCPSSHARELFLRLFPLPEPAVGAGFLEERVVVSLLHQAPLVQDKDSITGRCRLEFVADHQDRSVPLGANRAQDVGGRVVVHAGQGVIEHQERGLNQ